MLDISQSRKSVLVVPNVSSMTSCQPRWWLCRGPIEKTFFAFISEETCGRSGRLALRSFASTMRAFVAGPGSGSGAGSGFGFRVIDHPQTGRAGRAGKTGNFSRHFPP
jgi:hypothetical protein